MGEMTVLFLDMTFQLLRKNSPFQAILSVPPIVHRFPDDLRPFVRFRLDKSGELLGGRPDRLGAVVDQEFPDARILQHLDNGAMKLGHDLAGRPRGSQQTVPLEGLVSRHARFVDRGDVRRADRALVAGDPQRAQPPAIDVGYHRRNAQGADRYIPADDVNDGLARPLVGHMDHFQPGHAQKQLHRQMGAGSHAKYE